MKRFEKTQLEKIWVCKNDTQSIDQKYKDANKIEINIATDIHTRLLKRNRKHLNQSKNTPFAKGYLVDEIGLNGEIKEPMILLWDMEADTSC